MLFDIGLNKDSLKGLESSDHKNGHIFMLIVRNMLKKCLRNIQRDIELGLDSSPHSPLSMAHFVYYTAFLLPPAVDMSWASLCTFCP